VDNGAYVVAGYVLTASALVGYALSLRARLRRARARVDALAARSRHAGP
jgi:hypothetical protein